MDKYPQRYTLGFPVPSEMRQEYLIWRQARIIDSGLPARQEDDPKLDSWLIVDVLPSSIFAKKVALLELWDVAKNRAKSLGLWGEECENVDISKLKSSGLSKIYWWCVRVLSGDTDDTPALGFAIGITDDDVSKKRSPMRSMVRASIVMGCCSKSLFGDNERPLCTLSTKIQIETPTPLFRNLLRYVYALEARNGWARQSFLIRGSKL